MSEPGQKFQDTPLAIDTNAQRAMRENFGSEKPIPQRTKGRTLKMQEACRFYIHHLWDLKRCAEAVGLSPCSVSDASREDGWDEFAAMISETLKPSIWSASEIMVPDLGAIQREQLRRADSLPTLQEEEQRLVNHLSTCDPGTKDHLNTIAAIRQIRSLIDDATGATFYATEQSAGRKGLMAIELEKRKRQALNPGQPGDNAKPANGKPIITLPPRP